MNLPNSTLKGVRTAFFFLYLVGIVSLYYVGQALFIFLKILPDNGLIRWLLDQWIKDLWSVNQVGWIGRISILLIGWVGGVLLYEAALYFKKGEKPAIYHRLREKRKILYLIIALLAGFVMWYFRVSIRFVDMQTWERLLNSERWFFMSQPLGTAVMALAHRILREFGWSPQATIQLVNCIAGVGWIFLIFCISDEAHGFQKGLLLACVLLAGGISLFFGYMEVTPFPLFMGLLYFYLSIRALRGGSLFLAAVICGLTVVMHGEMVILLPSLLLLVIISWRAGQKEKALIALAWAIIPIILTLDFAFTHPQYIIGSFYGDALGGGDSKMFVNLGSGKNEILVPGFIQYSLFSASHFLELFNVMWVTSPFSFLLIFPAGFFAWRTRKSPETWFLLAFIVPALLFVVLWNPDLGMLVDWDLFAPPILLSMVASVFLWPEDIQFSGQRVWLFAALGISAVTLGLSVARFDPQKKFNPNNPTLAQIQNQVEANFGQAVTLLGYSLSDCCYVAGEAFNVDLFWRSLQRLGSLKIIEWQLVAGIQDQPIAEGSFPIASGNGKRPLSKWYKGELGDSSFELKIPPKVEPGVYQFWISLVDSNSGKRLQIGGENENEVLHIFDVKIRSVPLPKFSNSRRR
jgi:hypothetical protein